MDSYIVLAYRSQQKADYIVGVFDSLHLAFEQANEWMGDNGCKYDCTISRVLFNKVYESDLERSYLESEVLIHYGYDFGEFKAKWDKENATPSYSCV